MEAALPQHEQSTDGEVLEVSTNLYRLELGELAKVSMVQFSTAYEVTAEANPNKGGKGGGKKGKKGKGKGKGKPAAAPPAQATSIMAQRALTQYMADKGIGPTEFQFSGVLACLVSRERAALITPAQTRVLPPGEPWVINVTLTPAAGGGVDMTRLATATSARDCLQEMAYVNSFMKQQAHKHEGVEIAGARALFWSSKFKIPGLSLPQELALRYARELMLGYTAKFQMVRSANEVFPTVNVNLAVGFGTPKMPLHEFICRWIDPTNFQALMQQLQGDTLPPQLQNVTRLSQALVFASKFSLTGSDPEKPNLKVVYTEPGGRGPPQPKKKQIAGIYHQSAKEYWIPGMNMTVYDYFYYQKNISIKFPALPLVEVKKNAKGKGKGKKGKGADGPTLLPMEFFTVEEKSHNKDPRFQQALQGDIVRKAAMPPAVRQAGIQSLRDQFVARDVQPLQVQLAPRPTTVNARRLPVPQMIDGSDNAEEERDVKRVRLEVNVSKSLKPPECAVGEFKWAFMCYSPAPLPNQGPMQEFAKHFRKAMAQKNFDVGDPVVAPFVRNVRAPAPEIRNDIKNGAEKMGLRLLVVAIPDLHDDLATHCDNVYRTIKHFTEIELPRQVPGANLVTQFVRISTQHSAQTKGKSKGDAVALPVFSENDAQKLHNVAVKVITKLRQSPMSAGGAAEPAAYNYELASQPEFLTKGKRVMFVGGDVTHSRGGLSIASMVATADDKYTHYFTSAAPQQAMRETETQGVVARRAEERILDADEHMKELLKLWHARNGQYPDAIVYYRDGLSEGEFRLDRQPGEERAEKNTNTFEREVLELKRAVNELTGTEIPFAAVVCVKRHQVRFFPQSDADKLPPPHGNNNLRNGTVISDGVVHPDYANFFLISQLAGKGTARPTHYFYLWCDEPLKADLPMPELEKVTLYICGIYSRAQTPVSIASPAYMAHHNAKRALDYLMSDATIQARAEDLKNRAQTAGADWAQIGQELNQLVGAARNLVSPQVICTSPLQGVQYFC